jgi:hypothetical protein
MNSEQKNWQATNVTQTLQSIHVQSIQLIFVYILTSQPEGHLQIERSALLVMHKDNFTFFTFLYVAWNVCRLLLLFIIDGVDFVPRYLLKSLGIY